MAGRSRGRNSRFHYVNPRNNEHDDRGSRPSTSRGGGGYSDRHNFNKKVTFKSNNRGNYRKSWDNKTDLVRQQLDAEFSNQNGPGPVRNNSGRRSFPERSNNRHLSNNNFRNSFTLKESPTGWYSIFVPSVDDCEEVLKIIQTYITPVVFFPFNKQFFDNALRFLVDDYKIAKTLHNTSYKITLRDDRKLIIKVSVYSPPRGAISFTPVASEVREKMLEAMASRYNPDTKCLDLSKFYTCPLFTENQLFVPLNRPAVLLAALNIVAQHTKNDLYGLSLAKNHIYLGEGLIWIRRLFPELKVLDLQDNKFVELKELKIISGFNIEMLYLSGNPVNNMADREKFKRDVQQIFPMIKKLDDDDFQSRYSAVVRKLKMPINLDKSYPIPDGLGAQESNPLVSLVESFLTQFYERYDNNVSRQLVAEAYHENASFTLSSCFVANQNKGTLSQYMPESRNFLKCMKNKQGRSRFLHKGRENIVNFFDKLPKTKHDLNSFFVDVPFANAGVVEIVVNGVFAENFKATDHRHVFRSFCRTFCIVPYGSGWSILSDMLFVTLVTEELLLESSKRFWVFKPNSRKSGNANNNSNNSNNVSMFVEDNDEMGGIESSSFQQLSVTSNCDPPPYQQAAFPAYQQPSSIPTNLQQPPPYPGSMQMTAVQNQSTNFQPQSFPAVAAAAAPSPHQSGLQRLNESFSPSFNSASFPSSSSSFAPVPNNNQPSPCVPANLIGDTNADSDSRMVLIKSFSNESGMNHEWAKKCLEDNGWDYTKAALCFGKLKDKIPPVAFTQNTDVA